MADPGMAAHLRARSVRPCQSSTAVPVEAARARSAQNVACCSTTLARIAACAVLVRTWKPAKPEMIGPATRPMAKPIAIGFAAAHFAAAASRMVAVWLLMPSSSGAGSKKNDAPPRWRRHVLFRPYSCCLASIQIWRRERAITSLRSK